jgi:hypothetical protein
MLAGCGSSGANATDSVSLPTPPTLSVPAVRIPTVNLETTGEQEAAEHTRQRAYSRRNEEILGAIAAGFIGLLFGFERFRSVRQLRRRRPQTTPREESH